jgi:hypothetical protein
MCQMELRADIREMILSAVPSKEVPRTDPYVVAESYA